MERIRFCTVLWGSAVFKQLILSDQFYRLTSSHLKTLRYDSSNYKFATYEGLVK